LNTKPFSNSSVRRTGFARSFESPPNRTCRFQMETNHPTAISQSRCRCAKCSFLRSVRRGQKFRKKEERVRFEPLKKISDTPILFLQFLGSKIVTDNMVFLCFSITISLPFVSFSSAPHESAQGFRIEGAKITQELIVRAVAPENPLVPVFVPIVAPSVPVAPQTNSPPTVASGTNVNDITPHVLPILIQPPAPLSNRPVGPAAPFNLHLSQ
jgi:hypothetical protein